jgi:CAI-1 autoinducer synthase
MDLHYITAFNKLLGGEHPCLAADAGQRGVLAGNDYLCMAGEPALVAPRSLLQGGGAMLMSAVYLQQGSRQHRLERKLASSGQRRMHPGAVRLGRQRGLAADAGRAGHPVYLDMQAHASLWEACSGRREPCPWPSCTTTWSICRSSWQATAAA